MRPVTIYEYGDGFWHANAWFPGDDRPDAPVGNAQSFFRPLTGLKARWDLYARCGDRAQARHG